VSRVRRALLILAAVVLAVLSAAALIPLPEKFFAAPSAVIELSDGTFAHVFLSPDEKWRVQVELSEIDSAYLEALIRLEDKRFYAHPGVDPVAILRAAALNIMRGRVVSGGSTLTMQLVRVREPRPRSIYSKCIEAFRALQIELRYSKEEILAAYVTYVPFGKNVEGVEAASLGYFGHRANALSTAEIATLLAVPQMPARRYPNEKNAAVLKSARDEIALRLAEEGFLLRGAERSKSPEEMYAEIEAAPVPRSIRSFPRLAPHAAYWLRQRNLSTYRIKTTLDANVQRLAERTLSGAARELESLGIHNGTVVIVEHRTGELKALVGNFEFFENEHGAQIAGFDNPRSPGSALKPFIYAMAIDHGQVLPDFLVLDTPRTFGTYTPKNYDGRFSGLVRYEDALSRSLNVPFVNSLRKLGIEKFVGTLRMMGAHSLREDVGFYGLSSAIGGMELTPVELAGMYATLAANGEYRPLHLLKNEATDISIQIFSPGASHLTRRALALKDRPDFPSRKRYTGVPPSIFWKTGTSYGHRDAWAAGSGPKYTAVVWLGNFDNSPSVNLVGADVSGPILFDLLEALSEEKDRQLDIPPLDLKKIEVCAYSGRLPGPACEHRRFVHSLREHVPTEKCPYHAEVDVDVVTGLALTPTCRAGHEYRTEKFTVWPASLRRWLGDEHRGVPEPPTLSPECGAPLGERAPSIVSPPANHVALLIPGLARDRQEIPFSAESSSGRLAWFVDGEYLGSVGTSERLWWSPTAGDHEVVVTDDSGRSSKRRLEVRDSLVRGR
jgi:penicillin-binding protein 1C